MAATKRQMNWTGTQFTPGGGSAQVATGVTNCAVNKGISDQAFSGDGDHYVTTRVRDFADPQITVTTADAFWLNTVSEAARGVFVTVNKDAKLASGGDITYTLSNCFVTSANFGGQHRAFGSGSVTFAGESTDGVTSPLGVS